LAANPTEHRKSLDWPQKLVQTLCRSHEVAQSAIGAYRWRRYLLRNERGPQAPSFQMVTSVDHHISPPFIAANFIRV
jgi:hypothetical protein